MCYFGYTELIDKSLCMNELKINAEKLKGRFKLKIKPNLPTPLKITQLANEEISFLLHKRGDFLPRIEGKFNHYECQEMKDKILMLKVIKHQERDKLKWSKVRQQSIQRLSEEQQMRIRGKNNTSTVVGGGGSSSKDRNNSMGLTNDNNNISNKHKLYQSMDASIQFLPKTQD